MTDTPQFARGDVVFLKSGGHAMTVYRGSDEILCSWHMDDGRPASEVYPPDCLEHADVFEARQREKGRHAEAQSSANELAAEQDRQAALRTREHLLGDEIRKKRWRWGRSFEERMRRKQAHQAFFLIVVIFGTFFGVAAAIFDAVKGAG